MPDRGEHDAQSTPPSGATHLLRRFCPERWVEEVEGDLEEIYRHVAVHRGLNVARFTYWKEVVLFCLWHGLSRMSEYDLTWNASMYKNYLTVAWRNLRRQKGYALINVSGLALGMACCILILMLVRHEFSFDAFHEHADSVYRLVIQETRPDGSIDFRNLIFPHIGETMDEEFPAVQAYTNIVKSTLDLKREDRIFPAQLMMADSAFFEVFTFPLLAGNPATALAAPNGIVVTERMAHTLLGRIDHGSILGEMISLPFRDTTYTFAVTGLMADVPASSSLQFDAIISFKNYEEMPLGANDWGGRTSLYLRLAEGQNTAEFEHAIIPFTTREFGERIEARRQGGYIADHPDAFKLLLQPLRKLHLSPEVDVSYEETPHNPVYSYVLSGVALLVLLIACINFMILSIGRSTSRAKEVGMRKVLGAHRTQVMKHFWSEALLMGLVALVIGIALAALALPFFNGLTGKQLSLSDFAGWESLAAVLGLIVIVGLVAGGYPAAVLSGFQPVTVLKGDARTRGNSLFTRSLVVVQYTLSIGLIIGTLVMTRQLDYVLNRDLGFEEDQVVVIHTYNVSRSEAPTVIERFRNELASHDQVVNIARTGYSFTRGGDWNGWTDEHGIQRNTANFGIDYDYLDVMGMEIVQGRNFSREYPSDPTTAVLVNEALVREFGLANPIGHKLVGWGNGYMEQPPTIIGVVRDFNFQSLHTSVEPAVLNMHPDYYMAMGAMLVKVRGTDLPGTIRLLESTWNKLLPDKPFSYSFLSDDLANQYQTERRWRAILTYSSGFAILIACMGLFGLATLMVIRRTKEIGIRKVLGASVYGIMTLITREFLMLVLISSIVASPLAYFGMNRWLEGFAYRITVGPGVFIAAGALALIIALCTVSYQAIRAALTDPVRSLRYE